METQHKTLSKIADYLKHYPFLLVTIAGLVILTIVLIMDIEKLQELKLLLYGVVLLPICMQFFFEARKQSHKHNMQKLEEAPPTVNSAPATPSPQAVPTNQPKYSTKTVIGCVLWVMCLLAYGDSSDEELLDVDLQYGVIMFAGVGLWLSFSALGEIRRKESTGMKLTIANLILCSLFILSAIGWIMDAGEPY